MRPDRICLNMEDHALRGTCKTHIVGVFTSPMGRNTGGAGAKLVTLAFGSTGMKADCPGPEVGSTGRKADCPGVEAMVTLGVGSTGRKADCPGDEAMVKKSGGLGAKEVKVAPGTGRKSDGRGTTVGADPSTGRTLPGAGAPGAMGSAATGFCLLTCLASTRALSSANALFRKPVIMPSAL